jgi:hypothetical protein
MKEMFLPPKNVSLPLSESIYQKATGIYNCRSGHLSVEEYAQAMWNSSLQTPTDYEENL